MKDERSLELDLKAVCAVGGKPGILYVTPDASQLLVFDQLRARISFIGVSGWNVLEQVDLSPSPAFVPFLLAGFGDSLYVGGLPGMVGVFSTVTRRFSGAIPCGGKADDLVVFPETRQGLMTSTGPEGSRIERLCFSPRALLGSLELPGVPVRGTLVVSPDRSVAAVAVRRGAGDDLAFFPSELRREPVVVPIGARIRSLAFDFEGDVVYAACPESSSVVVVDLRERRVVDRLLMTGRPFQLETDPQGRRLWVLCDQIGHLALLDTAERSIVRRIQLAGLDGSQNRLSFSPEGRLAAVPELRGGNLSVFEADATGGRCGELNDRLELGREVGASAWSPLAEEFYASDPSSGTVLCFRVRRTRDVTKDTSFYLEESLRRRDKATSRKNPLFPP